MLNVTEINNNILGFGTPDIVDFQPFVEPIAVQSKGGTAVYVLLVQVLAAWMCYVFGNALHVDQRYLYRCINLMVVFYRQIRVQDLHTRILIRIPSQFDSASYYISSDSTVRIA
jgi:hypothetical protein